MGLGLGFCCCNADDCPSQIDDPPIIEPFDSEAYDSRILIYPTREYTIVRNGHLIIGHDAYAWSWVNMKPRTSITIKHGFVSHFDLDGFSTSTAIQHTQGHRYYPYRAISQHTRIEHYLRKPFNSSIATNYLRVFDGASWTDYPSPSNEHRIDMQITFENLSQSSADIVSTILIDNTEWTTIRHNDMYLTETCIQTLVYGIYCGWGIGSLPCEREQPRDSYPIWIDDWTLEYE